MEKIKVPQATTVEFAVISLMIRFQKDRELLTDLTDEYFYDPRSLKIFQAIRLLEKSLSHVNYDSIIDQLKKMGDQTILAEHVYNFANSPAHSDNLDAYKETLKENVLKRRLYTASKHIEQICLKDIPYNEMTIQSSAALTSLTTTTSEKTLTHEQAKQLALKQIKDRRNNKNATIKFNLKKLDRLLGGIFTGHYVIVGMTGSGKTALAIDVAISAALQGHSVLMFSAEMNSVELIYREIQKTIGISVTNMRTGEVTDSQLERIENYLTSPNFYVNDIGRIDIDELVSTATLHHRKYGLELLIVDYLQLLTTTKYPNSENSQIKYISNQLKALSKSLNIPILTLAQYNKTVDPGDKPNSNDIYGSGSIKHDADVILLIHKEYLGDDKIKNDPKHPKNGYTEMIVDKSRFSQTGSVFVKWVAHETRFADLPDDYFIPVEDKPNNRMGARARQSA